MGIHPYLAELVSNIVTDLAWSRTGRPTLGTGQSGGSLGAALHLPVAGYQLYDLPGGGGSHQFAGWDNQKSLPVPVEFFPAVFPRLKDRLCLQCILGKGACKWAFDA